MKIKNVIHKGLKRLIENEDTSGLQPVVIPKIKRMISFLQDMNHEDELRSVPSWKAHKLTGNRNGIWSLCVTRNWRLTFQIIESALEIIDLNYEDYH